jgi:hypothetical protein
MALLSPGVLAGVVLLTRESPETCLSAFEQPSQTLTKSETPPPPWSGYYPSTPLPFFTYEKANMSKGTNYDWVIPEYPFK